MIEQWASVVGFEGYYQVSSHGRVRNVVTGRVLSPARSYNGYLTVKLHYCQRVRKRIHRLVAEAFIRPPKSGEEVNHLDFNKANNRVENLRWCSPSENSIHAMENGRNKGPASRKLDYAQVAEIRKRALAGALLIDIAKDFGITSSAICILLSGRTYQGRGYLNPDLRPGRGRPKYRDIARDAARG